MDFLNAFVALSNFVLIPGIAYGSQLALGALGVTLIYGILRFSNFAHGDLVIPVLGYLCRSFTDRASGAAHRHRGNHGAGVAH